MHSRDVLRFARMITLICPLLIITTLLGTQGIPVQPNQSGTITGTLRDGQGRPAAGVRVSAVARPTSVEELGGAAMSSLTETDAQGRFILENVPPGRYYVAAGRLDFPTYFPGTQAMGEGTLVTVAAGATVPGIDFTMRDSSAGRADAGNAPSGTITVPLVVRVENGKVPLFGNGKFSALEVNSIVPAGTTAPPPIVLPLSQSALSLNLAQPNYQLSVEGLPPGYSVKSIQYGSTELPGGQLSLLRGIVYALGTTTAQAAANLQTAINNLRASLSVGGGVQGTVQSLTITLSRTAPPASKGATVTGALVVAEPRAISISGNPGTLYADGTFEFRDVPAGVHTIVAIGIRAASPVLGSALVIGTSDMNGIGLVPVAVPPANPASTSPPRSANGRPPGPIGLAALRGRFSDSESGQAVSQGSIFLIGGGLWTERELKADGSFEFSNVLPGRYDVEVHGVGYPTLRREVEVTEQDVVLELKGG